MSAYQTDGFQPDSFQIQGGVSAGANTDVNPGAGSLTITGYAPTVTQTLAAGYQFAVVHDYRTRGSVAVNAWIPVNPIASAINHSYRGRGSIGANGWDYVVPVFTASNTDVAPGAGSITFTGYAPSIAQGANQSILPGVGSLTITGYAPTIAQGANQAVSPGVGSLAITGYAPTLAQTANQAVSPGAGSLTITGYAPTVAQSSSASYGVTHSYVTRGSQSIVSWLNDGLGAVSGAINPGAGTLTITGYAPTIGQTVTVAINPGAGSLTITGYAPTITQALNQAINPDVGSLTITGYAPSIAQTANVSLVPDAGSMVITGYAPSVAQSVSDAVVGVVHNYVGRGSQSVVTWLNDGLSIPVTPPVPETSGFSAEIELHKNRFYVRRGKKIYLFDTAYEADSWIEADRLATQAVETAQKTSRRARKRLKDKVYQAYESPVQVIDGGLIELMSNRYGLEFDFNSLISNQDIDQILAMQALALEMQDEEDIELLLMA
jgi:hypothetical protein